MISLSFGEQVKIVLSRKNMTIKELAEIIEARTGKKMSRQNLTQRLGRDNFQEQDMRMIADILGCSFQLSILTTHEMVEKVPAVEQITPTDKELEKLAKKKEKRLAIEVEEVEVDSESERDMTIGELADIFEEVNELMGDETVTDDEAAIEMEENAIDEIPSNQPEKEIAESQDTVAECEEVQAVDTCISEDRMEQDTQYNELASTPKQRNDDVETYSGSPIQNTHVEGEDGISRYARTEMSTKEAGSESKEEVVGEVNPYTGREYQSNSVRMHPKRIGYVQVYDRGEHKWTDMTEWAFLGYQERKKALLGKEYEPPIYLD